MSAEAALQLALGELPDDAKQLYDHTHSGCRTLQYQSAELAHELGSDDTDGRVGVELEGESANYDGNAVSLVLMDLLDTLGEDASGC